VTAFSADWLALREPYDLKARNPAVLAALAAAVDGPASIVIIDLACGAGATARAIASHLRPRQIWRLVDNDSDLLARAAPAKPAADRHFSVLKIDIARDVEAALEARVDLVTASALLDLVSAAWLTRLTKEIVGRGLLFYAALTYDGRMDFEPADPFDAAIVEAVNRHQRRDKGFGPALGPTAAPAATARFEVLGYWVTHGKSDWELGPRDNAIQEELLAGWAAAAHEGGDLVSPAIEAWFSRRRRHIAAGRSAIRVGHSDFFARPTVAR
jgi:hypothetical protein